MNEGNYIIEFTIPRDLLLDSNLKLDNSHPNFDISISVVKRIVSIDGVNNGGTTAFFVNRDDPFGDNVKTRMKAEFLLKKDIFKDNFDSFSFNKENSVLLKKSADSWLSGEKNNFFIRNIVIMVNQMIETHQYVNNKYSVFPITAQNIQNIVVKFPEGSPSMFMGVFGGGHFCPPHRKFHDELVENSKRVSEFINNKDEFFEPLRIMNYSIQFLKMGLFRIALTEAQSAVEHLLSKKYFEFMGDEFPKPSNKLFYNFIEKLEVFSKIQDYFDYSDFEYKHDLADAKSMRNDIIHGKETPNLTKEVCSKYIDIYDFLFKKIFESKAR